jgi:ubiquitin carboxyl-terminal hydrolase 5/13
MDEYRSRFRPHMGACRTPSAYDKVYNDECVYSFETPYSEDGIYVSLSNWQGVGPAWLSNHAEKTGSRIYVHIKKRRVPKLPTVNEPGDNVVDNAAAAAANGGGSTLNDLLQMSIPEDKYDVVEELELVVLPDLYPRCAVPFPHGDIPLVIADSATAVVGHTGARDTDAVAAMVMDEEVLVSKYADELPMLENGKAISPNSSTWVCEESGMKENLWLNLSTGHIGRAGGGSGTGPAAQMVR